MRTAPVPVELDKCVFGWPDCLRLRNPKVELIVPTAIGPRILFFGFRDHHNILKVFQEQLGLTGGHAWRPYGGHRLWHAPEAMPRTYAPDNLPIQHAWDGRTLSLLQPVETTTGIQKAIDLTLDPAEPVVLLRHRLTNTGLWPVKLAPWALTMMAPGGKAVFPQEPFGAHPQHLLPARPLVLWPYTDMQDPRWRWGSRFIILQQREDLPSPQKFGIRNSPGWAAYVWQDLVFVKRFQLFPHCEYPDFNVNCEAFTNEAMLELESLGPLQEVPPGGSVHHDEQWMLLHANVGESEAELERDLLPLVEKAFERPFA